MSNNTNSSTIKKVLVYGLGVSGRSTVKTLSELGYEIYTYDKNLTTVDELKGYSYSPISDSKLIDYDYDFVVKSPGIPPTDDVVVCLNSKYEVIGDIELSYRLFKDNDFLAVTGSNGKTTTTSMVTHILNHAGKNAISVGNIGEGILWKMYKEDAIFVEELSSFQLHDSKTFHPHIAAILNITPDHIDWHGDYEDYINSKLKITINQTSEDYLVINHDDKVTQENKGRIKANIYEFSTKTKLEKGLYLDGDIIKFIENNDEIDVIDVNELKVIGKHNYENLMAAMMMTKLYGLEFEDIAEAAKTFTSIEHRLEFVDEVNGVKIYNDSKATNVDSAVKAVKSFSSPIIDIAGGYDKKIDYTEFVEAFKENGKLMILMGATKNELKEICVKLNVSYKLVADMDEAVRVATENASSGDVILLSPASASWDMYDSYEVRGKDFKEKIEKYKGNI